jgi:hypothetical protein
MTPKTVAEIERIRRHASTDDITIDSEAKEVAAA